MGETTSGAGTGRADAGAGGASAPRVLVVSASLRAGGVETTLALVLPRLRARGIRLHLALWESDGVMAETVLDGLPMSSYGARMAPERLPGFTRWLRRLTRQLRPDVLWAFHPRNMVPCVLAAEGLRPRPRVVGSIVGEAGGGRLDPLRRRVVRRVDALTSVTEETGARFAAATRYRGPLHVIGNAVDAAGVTARAAEAVDHPWVRDGAPLAVTVARLAPGKGVDVVITALAAARRRSPLRLIVVGDGPERAACERLAAALGVGAAVAFVGEQTNPLPYVAAADVFVLASASESMPYALLEAMAAGTPVVSTAYSGGWAELLHPDVDSLVVPVGDAEALAAALVRLVEDPALGAALAAAAAATVGGDHAADDMAAAYAAVLKQESAS